MTSPAKNTTTTVTAPAMTAEEYNAMLKASGLSQESGASVNRVKVEGLVFNLGENQFVGNPSKHTPAFRARILGPTIEYQAAWLDETVATTIGRTLTGFCKSFDFKFAEDGTACGPCPVGPWVKQVDRPRNSDGNTVKCTLKSDIELQVVDEDGTIKDETVWMLTLSTSAVIEFRGTSKNQVAGSASDLNFLQKLVRLGASESPDNPQAGVARALNAFNKGGIIADVYSLKMQNDTGSFVWYVPSFTPVMILDIEEVPAIETGEATPNVEDDLPF